MQTEKCSLKSVLAAVLRRAVTNQSRFLQNM